MGLHASKQKIKHRNRKQHFRVYMRDKNQNICDDLYTFVRNCHTFSEPSLPWRHDVMSACFILSERRFVKGAHEGNDDHRE